MNKIAGVFVLVILFLPWTAQAKPADDQNQIILLNDSASALEDIDPVLSKQLTQFAEQKERQWEARNANKNAAPAPLSARDKARIEVQIRLVKKAARAIGPVYPLITQGLTKMAHDMEETVKNGK